MAKQLTLSPTELGIKHGKQLIKKLSRIELERIARRKPMNEFSNPQSDRQERARVLSEIRS